MARQIKQDRDRNEWERYWAELKRTRTQTQAREQDNQQTSRDNQNRDAANRTEERSPRLSREQIRQNYLERQSERQRQSAANRTEERSPRLGRNETARNYQEQQKKKRREARQTFGQLMNETKKQGGYTDKERRTALHTLRELKDQEQEITELSGLYERKSRGERLASQELATLDNQRGNDGAAISGMMEANQAAQANERKILGLENMTPEKERELLDFYNRNSEKAKQAAWKKTAAETKNAYNKLRQWEAEEKRLDKEEEAYAALVKGNYAVGEDGRKIQEGFAARRAAIDAGKKNEQTIIDSREDDYKKGYQSIKDERVAWRQGRVSELEQSAAQMIGTENEGQWIQNWVGEYRDTAANVDRMQGELTALEASGQADDDVIAEARDRLNEEKKQLGLLMDMTVLTKPDFMSKSAERDESAYTGDIKYAMVNKKPFKESGLLDMMMQQDANKYGREEYDKVNETERAIYNYYYNTQGPDAASAYLDRIHDRLMYRNASEQAAEFEQLAKDHPAGSWAMSVAAMPMEMTHLGGLAAKAMTGEEISPYDSNLGYTRMKGTIRGAQLNEIDSPVGQFGYNVGTSIADMGMASLMGGGSSAVSAAFMGGSAGAASAYDTLLRGGSTKEAAIAGGAAAITETLTEKLPFDRLTKKFRMGQSGGSYKNLLSTFIKGFIPEGLEEVPGNFAEEAVDGYLMGKNSNRNQAINAYMDQGMRMDEAISQADKDFIGDTVMSFLAGGAAGGMMQTGAYGAGRLSARQTAKSIRESAPEVSEADAQAVGEMAVGLREQDEAVMERVAAQVQEAAYKEERNPFHAKANMEGKAVEVTGIESTGDGARVTVKQDGAEKAVELGDVQFGTEDARTAYEYAAVYDDLNTARQFLAGYEASTLPIKTYRRAFEAAYQSGQSGVKVQGANATYAGMLSPQVWNLAYKAGQQAGQQAAQAQDTRLEMDTDVQKSIRKTIEALPKYDMIEEGYTGAALRLTSTRLTSAQATQIALLDQLGKKYGTVYAVVDSLDGEGAGVQGIYKQGTNQMVVALNAEEGNLLQVAGHESWHYIKEHSQGNEAVKAYAEDLQEFVLGKLQATEGYDLEARIAEKTERYKNAVGQELTREEAMEEIMADSLVDVLATEENVRDLMENHATLGEKIMGFIKRFLKEVRGMLERIGKTNPEARAMLQQDEDTLQTVAENFDRVMVTLNALREAQGAGITVTGEGEGAKFSIRDSEGHEVIMTQEEFEENKRDVAAMKPVITVEGNAFPPTPGSKPVDRINAYFDSIGNRAKNEVFGEVQLENSGAEHLTSFISQKKAALIPAIKTVIEQGQLIDIDQNHKGRGFPTAVIAAPVTWNGEGYYMGVAIRQLNGNKDSMYYIHEAALMQQKEGDYSASNPVADADPASSSHLTIHSVLKTIRKYNGENGKKNVKYSLKDVDADNGDMARLLEENRKLRDLTRRLTQVLKESNLQKQEMVTQKLAKRLREQYGTKVPQKVLAENLQKAFDAMHDAETTGQSEAAMKIMSDIALDMLQKSEVADDTAWQESKDIRDRLRTSRIGLTDTQWQEAKSIFGSAREFRKVMMGKWMMPGESKQGVTTLDMIWDEICQQYPQYFDADASEGDMLAQVVDMYERSAIQYANPYGADIEQMANAVTMDIYHTLMDAKQVETENGAMDAMLNDTLKELEETKKEIVKQKNWYQKRLEAQQLRHQSMEARQREQYQQSKERQRQRREENAEKQKARASIIRNRDRIAKKLEQPKPGSFVPFQLSEAVEGLMEALDFTRDSSKTLSMEMLEKAKAAYMNAPKEAESRNGMNDGPLAAFYNGDLEETFNQLIDKSAGKMAKALSLEELNNLKEVVGGYAAMIVNEDRLFMQEKRDSLRQTGDQLMTEMNLRKKHTVQGGLTEWLQNGISRGLLKPVTVFEQLKGTAMEPVWKALRAAEGKHIRNVNGAAEYLQKALDTYHQQKSINEEGKAGKRKNEEMSREIKVFQGLDEIKIRLTDQELMTLYASYKREKQVHTNHLLGGGFTLENAPRGSSMSPYHITAEELKRIGDLLTEEQKNYVEHMVQYLSTTCAAWGNEVTRELYGIEKFGEGFYIPFSVVKNSVAEDPAEPHDARIKVGSFTKSLTREASNALVIKPFTELWCEHVEKMSDYNAFVLPIEDMTRLMNYRVGDTSTRMVLNQHMGKQATDYIMSFLRRLNGNGRAEMGSSWINTMMSHAKGAAVTFNLSVAIQQMGAGARAMAEISPKYFIPASISLPGQKKGAIFQKSYREMAKYAPIGIEKSWGYFDTNMSRGLYQRAQSNWKNRWNDWGGKMAEIGDQYNWGQIWEAVKRETLKTHSELEEGSEEYFEVCADRFTEVIDKTQVVDSIFQRCEWATEKGMMKNMMSFMSEPVTMYNMLYRQVWEIANTRKGTAANRKAWGKMTRTVTAILVSSAMTAALKSVVTALRDRDNEKKEKDEEGEDVIVGVRDYKDKYLESLWPNFRDNMLGVGTVFTNMVTDAMSGFTGGGDLSTAWLGHFVSGFKELSKGADADWEKGLYKLNQGASALLGIGFSNLHRDVKSIILTTQEMIGRDSLAGAAWDASLSMEKRLAAARKNYVYAKMPGDKRKENTGIYYDLLLTSFFEGGFGEDFRKVADAAIETGATQDSLPTTFKKRLRAAESRIPEAAQALKDGDMDTYAQLVEELHESGIGYKAINSMIKSEIEAMKPKNEDRGTGEGVILKLTDDELEDGDKAEREFGMAAYNQAVERGTPEALKEAVNGLRKSGMNDKELRDRVESTYKKEYKEAVWSGDDKEALRISAMLKGCGLGFDNDDFFDWVVDDGYTTIKKALEEGDGERAIKIRSVIYDRVGQEEADKKIATRIKNSANKMDENGKAAMRQVLVKLGYSKASIDKLVQ